MLGKLVRDRVPRRARSDVSVKLRPDPWIIVECAHPNGHLRTIGPFAAPRPSRKRESSPRLRADGIALSTRAPAYKQRFPNACDNDRSGNGSPE
jgi:hypothetical protein